MRSLPRIACGLAATALILSCQSSNPTAQNQDPTPGQVVSAQIRTLTRSRPDSVILSHDSQGRSIRDSIVTTTYADGRIRFTIVLPPDLGKDTIWTTWWVSGIPARTVGFAVVNGAPAAVADRTPPLLATLLTRLDTLKDGHDTDPARRRDLLTLIGAAIATGDPAFSNWSTDLPPAFLATECDSAALAWVVRSGMSFTDIQDSWLSDFDSAQTRTSLERWLKRGDIDSSSFLAVFPPPSAHPDTTRPSLKLRVPATESLIVPFDSSSALVGIDVSDASGIKWVRIGQTLLTSTPWESRIDLNVGKNSILVQAMDSAGNKDTLVVTIQRSVEGDRTAPKIDRILPKQDTIVPWATRSIVARWKISDDSTLARVQLGTTILTGADGLFESPLALRTGENRFILTATDARGNASMDTLLVVRDGDTTPPTCSRVRPKTDTVLSGTSDSLTVSWSVTDNDSVASVEIEGARASRDGSIYTRKLAAPDDATWIRIRVADASDNSASDSIKVTRLRAPSISPTSRGLKSPQLVTLTSAANSSIEYSLDKGRSWTPYTEEFEVSSNTSLLARTRIGDAVSTTSSAYYAFPPSFANETRSFLGADTTRFVSLGADSITVRFGDGAWIRADSNVLIDRSGTVELRSHVGSVVSPTTQAEFQVHSAEVVAGFFTTFLLLEDHTVWAAGRNDHQRDPATAYGIFGNGSTDEQSAFRQIMSSVKRLSPGGHFAIYELMDGTAAASGWNGEGQIGLGSTPGTSVAQTVMQASPYSGFMHSTFVNEDGQMFATGYNADGQLGDGTNVNHSTPVPIMDDVAHVSASPHHTLILRTDGSLWGTGSNHDGQLGLGSEIDTVLSPRKILEGVRAMAAGWEYSLVLMLDGTVKAMGLNDSGQLGDGTRISRNEPVTIPGLESIAAVYAGTDHSLFRTTKGDLLASGSNGKGQLGKTGGSGTNSPIRIASNVVNASANAFVTLYSLADGSVWASGANTFGGFGNGNTAEDVFSPIRVRLPN